MKSLFEFSIPRLSRFLQKKSFSLSVFLSLGVLLFSACEEIGPSIDFSLPCDDAIDTVYTEAVESPQAKVALLEELTGFNCVNCPLGHAEAKAISDANPGRLITVGIVDFPTDPHPLGRADYRTAEGANIHSAFLGTEPGYPSGAIDRKLFSGESAKLLSRFAWASKVAEQLMLTPDMNVYISDVVFDGSSRNLSCKVKVHYTSNVSIDQNLSVMVLENGIVDYQYTPSEPNDEDYENNHILRGMMTPFSGRELVGSKVAGTSFEKSFCLTIPNDWNDLSLEIVAFVHNVGGTEEVQQAAIEVL